MQLPAAYGGARWRARRLSHCEDVAAGLWHSLGEPTEVAPLREVVLARPSAVPLAQGSAEDLLFVTMPDVARWSEQAAALGRLYEQRGVIVHWAPDAGSDASANFIFQRDLFFRAPEGVILGRPASEQRAIEARWAASTLANLGVPILAMPRGRAVFECADALWLDPETVLVGIGTRTNREGFDFLAGVLGEMLVRAVPIWLPPGVQHLLGIVNFVDVGLAVARRCAAFDDVRRVLESHGVAVIEFAEPSQVESPLAMNFVTLAPRCVLMQTGCATLAAALSDHGATIVELDASEYGKAAGGLGCATGVLRRSRM